MHTELETTRIVRSWLEDGSTRLPDRVLEAVLDSVPSTRQRRSWWPAWRFPLMNTYARFAMAAAAVLVVAIVGINLLPGGGFGSPVPTPSPTPAPTVEPSPADIFPRGALAVGRQTADVSGVGFSFDIPTDGWRVSAAEMAAIERTTASGDHAWIAFWRPDNVYVWACASQAMAPAVGPGVSALADAMTHIQGTTGATTGDATVGGRPATLVEMTILPALDCTDAPLWYAEGADGATTERILSQPGDNVRTWIVDVDGARFVVDSDQAGADPELQAEIQQIVDSIQFE
jgi:hypothetical protein